VLHSTVEFYSIRGGLGKYNRYFQFGKVSRKARCEKIGRRRRSPVYLHGPWEYVGREPRFSRSPFFKIALFLYPVFAIITGVLKHLFTEPSSMCYVELAFRHNITRYHGR
jgi:hypothetical protein